ncbi:MAG: Maf family nucleotide pyrophosphatase [Clostridiales bacterium]|jgi:septum formation protein|nr:Maf family nucleotide pyrophosphatase [Clostridiales bacterium]MDR2713202.1 Maf family nucleotide pyrophosphatase [Clostridiales bacterium]
MQKPLILASASPRRLDLLRQIGLEPLVVPAQVREISKGLEPQELVRENAQLKAGAVAPDHPDALIIGADTLVYQDGRIFAKPKNPREARLMLELLSGSTHSVYTGLALLDTSAGRLVSGWRCTEVIFAPLNSAQIEAYIASGEPFDKAGGYGIQGKGGLLVEKINGDYGTVVGLSFPLLNELMTKLGIPLIPTP